MGKERKLTFEQALTKLEQIVQQIEQGQVSLEESIDKYAEGTRLIRQCRGILEQAEKKIQVLSQSAQGGLVAQGELEELDSTGQEGGSQASGQGPQAQAGDDQTPS